MLSKNQLDEAQKKLFNSLLEAALSINAVSSYVQNDLTDLLDHEHATIVEVQANCKVMSAELDAIIVQLQSIDKKQKLLIEQIAKHYVS